MYYVGIVDGSKKRWGVRIPDVPGCFGAGSSAEEAIADATSALREVVAHMAANDIAVAPPRTAEEIAKDKAAEFNPRAGEAFALIPLVLDRCRSVRANISLDAGLLEAIDDAAKLSGLTRSAFIASAALDKITGPR